MHTKTITALSLTLLLQPALTKTAGTAANALLARVQNAGGVTGVTLFNTATNAVMAISRFQERATLTTTTHMAQEAYNAATRANARLDARYVQIPNTPTPTGDGGGDGGNRAVKRQAASQPTQTLVHPGYEEHVLKALFVYNTPTTTTTTTTTPNASSLPASQLVLDSTTGQPISKIAGLEQRVNELRAEYQRECTNAIRNAFHITCHTALQQTHDQIQKATQQLVTQEDLDAALSQHAATLTASLQPLQQANTQHAQKLTALERSALTRDALDMWAKSAAFTQLVDERANAIVHDTINTILQSTAFSGFVSNVVNQLALQAKTPADGSSAGDEEPHAAVAGATHANDAATTPAPQTTAAAASAAAPAAATEPNVVAAASAGATGGASSSNTAH